ncbi:MAG: hypothetical protein AAGI90_05570 [Chlamydiota bacterium]
MGAVANTLNNAWSYILMTSNKIDPGNIDVTLPKTSGDKSLIFEINKTFQNNYAKNTEYKAKISLDDRDIVLKINSENDEITRFWKKLAVRVTRRFQQDRNTNPYNRASNVGPFSVPGEEKGAGAPRSNTSLKKKIDNCVHAFFREGIMDGFPVKQLSYTTKGNESSIHCRNVGNEPLPSIFEKVVTSNIRQFVTGANVSIHYTDSSKKKFTIQVTEEAEEEKGSSNQNTEGVVDTPEDSSKNFHRVFVFGDFDL